MRLKDTLVSIAIVLVILIGKLRAENLLTQVPVGIFGISLGQLKESVNDNLVVGRHFFPKMLDETTWLYTFTERPIACVSTGPHLRFDSNNKVKQIWGEELDVGVIKFGMNDRLSSLRRALGEPSRQFKLYRQRPDSKGVNVYIYLFYDRFHLEIRSIKDGKESSADPILDMFMMSTDPAQLHHELK